MLSLGWVVFWKAVVVALFGAATEAWFDFRKKRAQQGLPLRQDENGVYVPYDWAEKVELAIRFAGRCIMNATAVAAAILLAIWFYVKVL